MVRLKVSPCFRAYLAFGHFNSTMVRLKVKQPGKRIAAFEFQFHYGTIKRRKAASIWIWLAYFNSTMVRLKEYSSTTVSGISVYFNSTMVRLKDFPN